MIFNNLGVSLAFFLALAASPADASSHHRRLVKPQQSIADEVGKAKSSPGNSNKKNNGGGNNGGGPKKAGHGKPKFKLQGSKAGTSDIFEVNVRESTPAITSATTYSVNGGPKRYVKADALDEILVADNDDEDETGAGTVAIIAVNKKTGDVNGIVQRGRDKTKFTQKKNMQAWAFEAPEWEPPAWECGVSGAELESSHANESTSRHLNEDHHHHHDHHHDHDHDHFNLSEIKENLRGSSLRLGKQRRALQGVGYSYQVDIYIEIDNQLCIDNGEDCLQSGVIGPNTMGYVNALFAGANTIYEDEIDTHLGVAHVDINTNYDTATGTSNALSIMRGIYSSQNFGYAQGTPIDLHHALLSKNMGGGIAYVGVICNSGYGFGLSASLNGNYQSMSASVVWDMNVFMHELGHNFDSGHTHDYSPQIDTCGDSCPAGLPLAKSATIMSYCHLCSGSYSNIDYTFGGKYNGSGSRSDLSNYQNSPLAGLGTISNEPRRVNVQMYNHVSGASCATVPTGPPPPPSTPQPTPVATPNPTQAATPPPTPCPGTDLQVQIDLKVDNYPEETTWALTNTCTNTVVQSFQGSTAVPDGTQLSDSYCVPAGAYEFTINDAYGDGICCNYGLGNYKIFLNGNNIVSATGEFGQSETRTFGPPCPTIPTNPPTPAPSSPPTTLPPTNTPTKNPTKAPTPNPTPAPSSNPTPAPSSNPTPAPTPNPTPAPSSNPTPGPSNQPSRNPTPAPSSNPTPGPSNQPSRNPTPAPSSNPTPGPSANPSPGPTNQPVTTSPTNEPTPLPTNAPSTTPPTPCVEITIEIQTDMHPDQTAWSLADACTGETIVNSPMISVPGATYSNTYCLPPTEFKFMITDSLGDGLDDGSYTVLADSVVVASGSQFGGSESTNFGSCAP